MEMTFLWIFWCACFLNTASADTGYFWHITDFHYDFTYHGSQLSCNADNRPVAPGKFGNFWCDSPWALVNSSVSAMASIKKNVDFILWTGDTVLHAKDEHLSYNINADILDNTTDILKMLLPGVKVYASFGNHDYFPNNQFPPSNNQLYNDTWVRWQSWVGDPTQGVNFRNGGYYTVKTQHGLRIIALNTNLYYTSNKATQNSDDPGNQLDWLNTTLQLAAHNNEKVLVTAHIPPGVHTPNTILWMYPKYNTLLADILQRHANIIVGLHFGHDHADGFKILSNTAGEPTAPIFIAPSVTPWRYIIPSETGPAHNPGIRLITYDRGTGKHLDLQQYYLDLQNANQNGVAEWKIEYRASSEYGLTDLTASNLKKLADKMADQSGSEFVNYWKFYTVSAPTNLRQTCDQDCHDSIVCGFTEFHLDEFNKCKRDLVSNGCINCIHIYALIGVIAVLSINWL